MEEKINRWLKAAVNLVTMMNQHIDAVQIRHQLPCCWDVRLFRSCSHWKALSHSCCSSAMKRHLQFLNGYIFGVRKECMISLVSTHLDYRVQYWEATFFLVQTYYWLLLVTCIWTDFVNQEPCCDNIKQMKNFIQCKFPQKPMPWNVGRKVRMIKSEQFCLPVWKKNLWAYFTADFGWRQKTRHHPKTWMTICSQKSPQS